MFIATKMTEHIYDFVLKYSIQFQFNKKKIR